MFKKINEDLKQAMLAKDQKKVEVLRMMKSKIMNVNPKGDLEDSEIIKILEKYAKSLKETIDLSKKGGRDDAAKEVQGELIIVEGYLPKKLSKEESEKLVEETIGALGVSNMSEIGKVMKEIMSSGKNIDGAMIKEIVQSKLS